MDLLTVCVFCEQPIDLTQSNVIGVGVFPANAVEDYQGLLAHTQCFMGAIGQNAKAEIRQEVAEAWPVPEATG